jgi:hypothetical protein
MQAGEAGDLAVFYLYDHSPLRAAFADTTALEIAGKNDRGVGTEHFVSMIMAERPVLIPALKEILHGTGRVVGMVGTPVARRMQHTDIEHAGFGGGICQRQVLRNRPIGEALTVQCYLDFWYSEGLRPPRREYTDRFW